MKKLRNNVAIPKRGSEEAAGYDIASARRHSSPYEGQSCNQDRHIYSSPRRMLWKNCTTVRPHSKKFIDVGAGVIDVDY